MSRSRWRLAMPWLLLVAVGLGVSALRFGLIESSEIGQFCSSHHPWWCEARLALVLGFLNNVYGVTALVAAALALVSRRQPMAWLAAAVGLFAMQLYGVQTGALALLIGSLRLLRLQANAGHAPVEPDRQRQQQIQTQP